jgi:hypothetical protein
MDDMRTALRSNPGTSRRLLAVEDQVRSRLRIETLNMRNRDCLDIHEVSAASIRAVIEMVFMAGFEAGAEASAST